MQTALRADRELGVIQPVVEKELLHHDILRELADGGLLADLTFMGGTCLRTCYGSNRLSEDLDFTGGADFSVDDLRELGTTLKTGLYRKYELPIEVSEPKLEADRVATWKLRLITRPEQPDLPQQRIHIDICAVPSHDRRPMTLQNHYGVELGTSGLLIQAESRAEILADKMLALALRPNRIKHRDVWDLLWLVQQGEEVRGELLTPKLTDRGLEAQDVTASLTARHQELTQQQNAFETELRRFLPTPVIARSIDQDGFWDYATNIIADLCRQVERVLLNSGNRSNFRL